MASKNLRSNDADTVLAHVTMNIHRIHPYERNPRQGRNPEYDRIKDSIRHNGLDQPLVITQRPDATDYVVYSGGNTRLVILKELFEETGDARYGEVPCFVKLWCRESDVVLAHLRENDLRGNLTFIDKARAVTDARDLFCEELGLGSVTQRQFADELSQSGYRISHSSLSLMAYAVESLFDLIPRALEAGMGRDQIKRLRALERAGRALWLQRCTGGERAFDESFAQLCRRYDGEAWDNTVLQGAIETEIAEASESNLHTIRAALDVGLDHREVVIPEFVAITAPPERETCPLEEMVTRSGVCGVGLEEDSTAPDGEASIDPLPAMTSPGSSDEPKTSATSSTLLSIHSTDPPPNDLKSLRGRAWTLAARIGQRNGLGDLVLPLSGNGLGYVLRDVPDPLLADQVDETVWAHVCALWWQLAACAELTVAPLDSILPLLPDDSILRRAIKDDDAALLFNSVLTLDPGHTGYRLWRLMGDGDWQDLISLMDNYRCIRHLATQTGELVWS